MRLGDDVLVLDRDHRHVEPDHARRSAARNCRSRRPRARTRCRPCRSTPPIRRSAAARCAETVVLRLISAPPVARALRERLRQIGGLDIAILRMLDRADDALDIAQRPDLLDLLGRQEPHLDADRRGDAGVIIVLVHPVVGAREADVGDLAEADILARLGLERLVEPDRVFVHLADRIAEVEQRQAGPPHARSSRRSAPCARPARCRSSLS